MTFGLLLAEQGSAQRFPGNKNLFVGIQPQFNIKINITREILLGYAHVRDLRKLAN